MANITVSSGVTSVGGSVLAGEVLTVYGGGVAISINIASGGSANIATGGSVSTLAVASGGLAVLSGQGFDIHVESGGEEDVGNGAVASSTNVNGGREEVEVGGTSQDAVVSGGVQAVYGRAYATTVNWGGNQYVSSGGLATGTIVNASGVEEVFAGGRTFAITVNSGGEEAIFGSASGSVVSSGGIEYVFAGGVASGTLLIGGRASVLSSGSASLMHIQGGGLTVQAGGTASGTLLDSGFEAVSGTVFDTTVGNGGVEHVYAGGTASGTTVNVGGGLKLSSGGRTVGATINNAYEVVSSGGSASGTVLNTYGAMEVGIGGSTFGATVNGSGVLLQGGNGQGTTVNSGGQETVQPDGSTTGTTVNSGGLQHVEGFASATVVNDGGLQEIEFGTTSGTEIRAGGTQRVLVGTASVTVASSGGAVFVSSGGHTIGTTVQGGASETISSGGTATGTVVDGGTEVVSGGITVGNIVQAAGTERVYVHGTASGTVVRSGGSQHVSSGGSASGSVVSKGGVELVSAGGATIDTTVAGGEQDVGSGATTTGTTLFGGGRQYVSQGGITSATVVSSGGSAYVSAGGVAIGTVVSAGGSALVALGARTSAVVLSSGGSGLVFGRASGTVIEGGVQMVSSGGQASGTVVNAGGVQSVLLSATAMAATVNSGGQETVFGRTSNTVLSSGGAQYVASGGIALGTVVSDGGREIVLASGTASGIVLLSGGAIDLTAQHYDSAGTATLDSGTDLLTIAASGTSFTVQLGGDYTGEYFHLGADGTGGTVVTVDGTPCYCRGTLILTDRGEIAVERLAIGDRLVTRSGSVRPIRWIGRRIYSGRFAAGNRDILPVRISRGALAEDVPRRDLFVSPLHAMFIDGVLIPARALVDGISIVQVPAVDEVAYFHLELDSHDVILAEGALSETFVDDDSRGMFHNAAEYRLRYPDAVTLPARYCAPRVEDGEALDAVRRQLAMRSQPRAPEPVGPLLGRLDRVGRDRIEGWAQDGTSPRSAVLLRVLDNGVAIARLPADRYRMDLERAGVGAGRHGFSLEIPGGLAPQIRHVLQVLRAADGRELEGSPWILEPDAAAAGVVTVPFASCRGHVDDATRDLIAGWAQDEGRPQDSVALHILDNGVPIAQVLANRYRADLAASGIGDGRHGFELRIPGGLSPLIRHVIQVRRAADGREVGNSPVVIEAARSFDHALEQAVSRAVAAVDAEGEQARVLSFLVAQADRLLQQRAEAESQPGVRLAHRQFRRRWGSMLPVDGTTSRGLPNPGRRALVVDDAIPDPDRDAGSQAVLSHMRALQQLGYAVTFVAAHLAAADEVAAARLAASGIMCCRSPFYASVEDVLQRQSRCFDVIYLHRISNASKYLELSRQYFPQARILYSVADLHHLRLARQAEVEQRPELLAQSRRLRLQECTAAWSADAVLTHSTMEADVLRQAVRDAQVHVVPWHVPAQPTAIPFAARHGVAFVGGYSHSPNADAACFLAEEVMPLVWQLEPGIECLLVGSRMPDAVRDLARPGLLAVGPVADLSAIFDRVRLTVAPLRYGAGVKGKVLTSLAAGIPCVMSPIAAEGIDLPASLAASVGTSGLELAALIVRLHRDADANRAAAEAGSALIRTAFDEAAVAEALRAAIGMPAFEAAAMPEAADRRRLRPRVSGAGARPC